MLFGASIGREGPSVQVGAAVMGAWGAWCKKHGLAFKGMQENDLMAAGAAGGLAAAFNAPLAGVIFAIEELGRGIMLRWERQILLGVLAAGFIQVAIQGNNPYFRVSTAAFWKYFDVDRGGGAGLRRGWRHICPYALSRCGGVCTAQDTRLHPQPSAAAGGTDGAAARPARHVLPRQNLRHRLPRSRPSPARHLRSPVGLAAAKWLATVFSYWAGIPGGIFTPSLTIGAVLGEHIAAIADISQGANIIVLICMAAFLAGATQSPITSAVVMEMTGGQSLLFWMLIACIFASQVSRQFSPRPFYHASGMRFRRRVLQETAAQTGNAPARPQAANSKTGMPSEN
ncbi:Chloride channel protein-related protein [Neisseria gonorrhoeae]|uniref:Chloride channel protein-related protein n=1 Tax=Neisseria gonorrhoeae TaxID=485 RepID=A0A378VUU6_NEIGO|nr:Chloride channel protein-related protein [Neisseria gonorrhoeae]